MKGYFLDYLEKIPVIYIRRCAQIGNVNCVANGMFRK
jgi:hypothetical protein